MAMAGGSGVARLAPAPMGGATVAVWVAWARASVFSPAVRLSIGRVWADDYRTDAGGADFALDSAALHLCPVRFAAGRFGAFVCAAGLVGRLHAQGVDTLMPQSHVRPFAAVGGAVLGDCRLTRSIFLTLSFDVSAPLIRDSFQFRPEIFHRVPATILGGAAGIGYQFCDLFCDLPWVRQASSFCACCREHRCPSSSLARRPSPASAIAGGSRACSPRITRQCGGSCGAEGWLPRPPRTRPSSVS